MEVGIHVWPRYLCSGEVVATGLSQQMTDVLMFVYWGIKIDVWYH
jgi:hypothetical protein